MDENQSITEVSRNLSISTSVIYKGGQEYTEYGENAFLGKGTAIYNQQYKQRALEKENAALKEDITRLKKYRAFLRQIKKYDLNFLKSIIKNLISGRRVRL